MADFVCVADDEWAVIGPLLPTERGRRARPAHDNRQFFEGMLWVARTGAQWRHLPVHYGKWNSVFRRFRRWRALGVLDRLDAALAILVEQESSGGKIDLHIIRAHQCAVVLNSKFGGKSGSGPRRVDDAGRVRGRRTLEAEEATLRSVPRG